MLAEAAGGLEAEEGGGEDDASTLHAAQLVRQHLAGEAGILSTVSWSPPSRPRRAWPRPRRPCSPASRRTPSRGGYSARHTWTRAPSRCCHAMSRVTLMLHVTWQTGRSRLAAGCRCWPPPPPCPRGWSSTGYCPARSGHSEGSTLAVKTVETLTCTR